MNSQIKNRQRKLTDQVHNATFKKKQTVISVMKGNYCKNNGSLLVCKKTYKNYKIVRKYENYKLSPNPVI